MCFKIYRLRPRIKTPKICSPAEKRIESGYFGGEERCGAQTDGCMCGSKPHIASDGWSAARNSNEIRAPAQQFARTAVPTPISDFNDIQLCKLRDTHFLRSSCRPVTPLLDATHQGQKNTGRRDFQMISVHTVRWTRGANNRSLHVGSEN